MSGARITNYLNFHVNLKKKIVLFLSFLNQKKYLLYFFLIVIFFVMYALVLNQIKSHKDLKKNNFSNFLNSDEYNNIKEYVFENLNSPYREYNYTVENNDTLEKILKKYNIKNSEINKIAAEIRKKNYLIYMQGQKLKL